MNKVYLFFIIFLFLFVLGMQTVFASITYPLLTQDSVYTRIENGKSITTFRVTAPSTDNYLMRFWLMGVLHSDSTYSSYGMRIDNNPISTYVTTNRGDWHLYRPDNSSLTYFTQGQHEIHLEGTLDDVPNAEKVITLPFLNMPTNANTRYALMKQHISYDNSIPIGDTLDIYYRELNYNRIETDTTKAPIHFNAELNKLVYYTFFRIEYYTKGQTVSIVTDEEGGIGHVLQLFSKSWPSQYTWADSTYNGHVNMTVTIPKTDFYYVMVRTQSPDEYGTCSLTINGDRRFENVPVSCSYTPIQELTVYVNYSCFAKSSLGDPMILLMSNDGKVHNYNDDYPYNPQISDYKWGTNARINGFLFRNMWLMTTAKSYPPETMPLYDIYAACKSENYAPGTKYDDVIYSSDLLDYPCRHFNCISWSVGNWMTWIDPYQTIEEFDSLYALHGFERTSDASQSKIDLWSDTTTHEFKHASIKAKAHLYAAGYDWESKKGNHERVFHPRYSLSNYGIVSHYYKKATFVFPPVPYLSFAFTNQEIEQIESGIKYVAESTKSIFYTLYEECYEDRDLMLCSNTNDFPRFASYRKLLEFCRETKGTVFLLYKEICDRKVLPVRLLKDLTESRNPLILEEVEKQCKRLSRDNGIKAIRNVQADGVLLAKMLLSDTSDYKKMIACANKSVIYSSDNFMNITVECNKLDIAFHLEYESKATVVIGSPGGLNIETIADKKTFANGQNHVYYYALRPGIYTISIMINGGLYEKKVYVK